MQSYLKNVLTILIKFEKIQWSLSRCFQIGTIVKTRYLSTLDDMIDIDHVQKKYNCLLFIVHWNAYMWGFESLNVEFIYLLWRCESSLTKWLMSLFIGLECHVWFWSIVHNAKFGLFLSFRQQPHTNKVTSALKLWWHCTNFNKVLDPS